MLRRLWPWPRFLGHTALSFYFLEGLGLGFREAAQVKWGRTPLGGAMCLWVALACVAHILQRPDNHPEGREVCVWARWTQKSRTQRWSS